MWPLFSLLEGCYKGSVVKGEGEGEGEEQEGKE